MNPEPLITRIESALDANNTQGARNALAELRAGAQDTRLWNQDCCRRLLAAIDRLERGPIEPVNLDQTVDAIHAALDRKDIAAARDLNVKLQRFMTSTLAESFPRLSYQKHRELCVAILRPEWDS